MKKISLKDLKNTRQYLRQLGNDSVAVLRQVLVKNKKKATGFTANSIRHEETLTTETAAIKIFADESLQYINDGTPKDGPMPPSIFSRKGRHLNSWFVVKGIPRTLSTDFMVRRKISNEGIDAKPVLKETEEKLKTISKQTFEKAVKKDIYEIGLNAFRAAIEK